MIEQHIKIPPLRFPEFKGDWVRNTLGEIARFSKGKGLSKSDISENGITECIRYGELYTTYNETIDKVYSKTNINSADLVLSEANDIIIPASGETQIDIAKASCVLKSGVVLGGDLNIIKTSNNGVFLSYYLNSKKKNDIAQMAQGISVVHLYSGQLSKLQLNLPSLPEQQKIAYFFTAIDQNISQIKQKKTLLEQYKKGVMQKIFSQQPEERGSRTPSKNNNACEQIRFKDDNGQEFPEWDEKKLGEVAEIKTGNKDTQNKVENGLYPFFVRSDNVERINSYAFDGEAILTSGDGVGVGKNFHYIIGKFDFHQRVYAIRRFKENYLGKFIFYVFSTKFYKRVIRMSAKNSVDSVRMDMISEMPFSFPNLLEQTKIANFLSAIDNKINHTQTQIEKAELWKKGLLQQMFV